MRKIAFLCLPDAIGIVLGVYIVCRRTRSRIVNDEVQAQKALHSETIANHVVSDDLAFKGF